jgi:hypothetical protein
MFPEGSINASKFFSVSVSLEETNFQDELNRRTGLEVNAETMNMDVCRLFNSRQILATSMNFLINCLRVLDPAVLTISCATQ